MPNPLTSTSLVPAVVATAKRFVGEKETPGNNSGFADPQFQRDMQAVGWQRGQSWCAYLTELIFKTALLEAKRDALWANIESLFSASALETLHRFEKKGYSVHQVPKVGDLAVWRHGAGPAGHIGVVVGVGKPGSKMFVTVEGNTSGKSLKPGSDGQADTVIQADGDGALLKNRQYGIPVSTRPGSFNLLGFVSPVS